MAERDVTATPLSEAARDAKIGNLAKDLAEKKLADGTATSQIILQYLVTGSRKRELELEKLRLENELLREKIKIAEDSSSVKEMVENVMEALRNYQ